MGDPMKCSCGATKQAFGTKAMLCPACDFARCKSENCKRTVQLLSWSRCPHCGTYQ